jgi:Uma2 family endonuclease
MNERLTSPYCPVPPSSADLVCDAGEPMESARHVQQMNVLITSLEDAWRARQDFYVGGNMFLYFSEIQARNNDFRGPDVFVVMNTPRRERRAWVVWEEEGRTPDVIIELLSDTTEKTDRGKKMQIYAHLKVGEYYLFDPWSGTFEGYELDAQHCEYRRKTPDDQGRLSCKGMELLLGKVHGRLFEVETDWLRWIGPDGQVLALPQERADAEAQRAEAEAQRAEAEAQRANLLAAEVEALKAALKAPR